MIQMKNIVNVWRWMEEATEQERLQGKACVNFITNTYRKRQEAKQKAELGVQENELSSS